MADFVDEQIEEGLKTPGAVDVTAKYRGLEPGQPCPRELESRPKTRGPSCQRTDSSRKVNFEGGVFVRPTIVLCDSIQHPLANCELLCPCASVVEIPQSEMLKHIDYTLACTAITKDAAFIAELMPCPHIQRLNLGPVSTMKISWNYTREGNMFEFLWQRRSIEQAW